MRSCVCCLHYVSLLIIISSSFSVWESVAIEEDTSIKLGDKCRKPEQCRNATSNSTCSDGICMCEEGFFSLQKINGSSCESDEVDKTDEEYAEPPKVRQQQVDPKMIIIMVVLAVMFIGICVALHLFSKARFRNHRTIFNSPHPRLMHIKLGKKKGRRRASHTSLEVPGSRQLSICSQFSPLQSRRGSTAASPDSNHKTRRSNSEKKDYSEKGDTKAASDSAKSPGSPTVIVSNNRGGVNKAHSTSARV